MCYDPDVLDAALYRDGIVSLELIAHISSCPDCHRVFPYSDVERFELTHEGERLAVACSKWVIDFINGYYPGAPMEALAAFRALAAIFVSSIPRDVDVRISEIDGRGLQDARFAEAVRKGRAHVDLLSRTLKHDH